MTGVENVSLARSERSLEGRVSALEPHGFRVRLEQFFDRSACERIEIADRNVEVRQ